MKSKYKILLNYIKDLSIEIPNPKTLIIARENIPKYIMHVDITPKALKNKMIEVATKLTYKDKVENNNKSNFEIVYATVIKILDDKIKKEELERLILCELQIEIYPRLERIFLNIMKDAGFPNIKFSKKIDFKELYNKSLN